MAHQVSIAIGELPHPFLVEGGRWKGNDLSDCSIGSYQLTSSGNIWWEKDGPDPAAWVLLQGRLEQQGWELLGVLKEIVKKRK